MTRGEKEEEKKEFLETKARERERGWREIREGEGGEEAKERESRGKQ